MKISVHVINCGTATIIPIITIVVSIKGIRVGTTLPTLIFIRSAATYRQFPTGGVTNPIPQTMVINTPSTIGSTPTDIAIGYTIGTKSVSVAMDSINIVTMKNINKIIINITVGLVENPSIISVNHKSKPAVVSITVNNFAAPITRYIFPLVLPVSIIDSFISSQFNSLYTKPPTTKAYTTATSNGNRFKVFSSESTVNPIFLQFNISQVFSLLNGCKLSYVGEGRNMALYTAMEIWDQLSPYTKGKIKSFYCNRYPDFAEFISDVEAEIASSDLHAYVSEREQMEDMDLKNDEINETYDKINS